MTLARAQAPQPTTAPGGVPAADAPKQIKMVREQGAPVLQEAHKISGRMPAYPAKAREAGIHGMVRLKATISKEGAVENLSVLSGDPLLAQATMEAVATWVYQPALRNGVPEDTTTVIALNFGPPAPETSNPAPPESMAGGNALPGGAAPQPPGRARISSGVVSGLKIGGDAPVYPPMAKAAHVSGMVVLHAVIGKDGHIENLTVVSGSSMLTGAALDAVKTWVYKPYLLRGEPTEVDTTITVNFNAPLPPTGNFNIPHPPQSPYSPSMSGPR